MSRIKCKAEENLETLQQILTYKVRKIGTEAAAQLPLVRQMHQTFQTYCQKGGQSHPIPTLVQDMEIPEKFKTTTDGDQFLMYDTGHVETRMLFSTERMCTAK